MKQHNSGLCVCGFFTKQAPSPKKKDAMTTFSCLCCTLFRKHSSSLATLHASLNCSYQMIMLCSLSCCDIITSLTLHTFLNNSFLSEVCLLTQMPCSQLHIKTKLPLPRLQRLKSLGVTECTH